MAEDSIPEQDAPVVSAVQRLRGATSWWRLALEVALVSAGVFLGLAGDQWRDNAEHRSAAQASLRRFRNEIITNRAAVLAVQDYRVARLREVKAYLTQPHNVRNTADVHVQGLRAVHFEETAWDLAVATQSLTYLDSELAAKLSRLYARQERIGQLNRGIVQSMYLLPWRENFDAFAGAVEAYFGDLVVFEPELIKMYDDILPQIDKVLGKRRD